LQFTAMANKSYTIERRDTLDPTSTWVGLISFAAQPSSSVIQVTDSSANASRFYRLRTPKLP